MCSQDPGKPSIVWLDHDKNSLENVLGAIRKLKLTRTVMKTLDDLYDFQPIVIKPENNYQESAYAAIQSVHQKPGVILVDLSFGSHSDPEDVLTGRELASHMAQKFPMSAVGVYTRYPLLPRHRAIITSDGFAVVLEKISEAYDGPQNMGGDDWNTLFQKMLSHARAQQETLPKTLTADYGRGITKWAPGHPHYRSYSFEKAACNLVNLALDGLDPAPSEINITQIGGGFSGSFVVRATAPDRKQSFIVKIDEDPTRLRREVAGHRAFQSVVSHRHYLPLLSFGREQPVVLRPDWWGAIVMAYEGKAKPLIEHHSLVNGSLANLYRRIWSECLSDLYGTVSERDMPLSDVVTREVIASASDDWNAIERYHNLAMTPGGQQPPAIPQFTGLLMSGSDVLSVTQPVLPIPWVEKTHGDLNCRNILYDADDQSFYLIDFPGVCADCLALDFVKAEAESVLTMMDWTSGLDHDFRRIQSWDRLVEMLSSGFCIADKVMDDSEANLALTAVKTIREAYSGMHQDKGEPALAYRLYLIATVLPYIGYSDVSVAKKLLAALWVGRLAEAAWGG